MRLPAAARSGMWAHEVEVADSTFRRAAGEAEFAKMGSRAPLNVETAVLVAGSTTVRFEILLGAGICETGANDKDATDVSAQCPAKVVVSHGGAAAAPVDWRGCFVDVPDKRGDGDPDPRTNGAFAYLDASGTRLSVEAIQAGAPTPGCTRSMAVPAGR